MTEHHTKAKPSSGGAIGPATALGLCLLLGGCASGAYTDEATQLGAAATRLADSVPAQDKVDAEGAAVLDFTTDLLMANGPIRYTGDCGDRAFVAYKGFVASLVQDEDAQAKAYGALLQARACALSLSPPAAGPPAAAAGPGAKSASRPDPAAEAQLARDEARQAADDGRAHLGPRPPGVPLCKASCSLDDYTRQIKAYGDAIEAASAAKSASDAQMAAGGADAAADGLLKAAKAPPPAAPLADAVAAVGKLAVQQAQYAAMKHAVLTFDRVWPKAAPAVTSAARFRQAQLIGYRADASQAAALTAQQYLNDSRFYRSPAERLQLFDSLNAKVEAAGADLQSAKIDPGVAIAAFTRANHALALAMDNPGRQTTTFFADLKAVEDQVAAVQKAAAPAKSANGATHG